MVLLKNVGFVFLVIISVVVLISSIIYLAPVDPARLTFGQRMDDSSLERKQKELYLDKPLAAQLLYYLNDISPISVSNTQRLTRLDLAHIPLFSWNQGRHIVLKQPYFRESYQSGRRVSTMIIEAFPKTLILALTSILIASFLGIFLGIIAALYKHTWVDYSIIIFSTMGISIPSYVSAIFLALIFGLVLGDFTGLNIQGSIIDLDDLGNRIWVPKNLILPAIALGIRPLSIITQLMRASLIDVLSMPYMTTARAKGLSFVQSIKKHALRNSLNPVITAITGWMASLLAGTFFVENVFNFKGLGELTVTALINYDIPVILACVILVAVIFVLINLVVDVLYRILDPRLR